MCAVVKSPSRVAIAKLKSARRFIAETPLKLNQSHFQAQGLAVAARRPDTSVSSCRGRARAGSIPSVRAGDPVGSSRLNSYGVADSAEWPATWRRLGR
jgi:hypothetical protein